MPGVVSGSDELEEEQPKYDESQPKQVGGGEVGDFCYLSSDEYTQSDANVPGGEVGGVGGTSLVVARQVDEHGLEGRADEAVSHTKDCGGEVEACRIFEEYENGVAHYHQDDPDGDECDEFSPVHKAGAQQAGTDESDGHEHEKESGTAADPNFCGSVDGDEGGYDAEAEGE